MELTCREGENTGLLLLLFLENVIVKRKKCAAEGVDAKKALKGYIIFCYLFTKVKDLQAVA